jgi:predicted lactoylglutathione lyase
MPDPSRWPSDYRTFAAVIFAAVVAMGLVEARMHTVAAQEVAPTKERVLSLTELITQANKKLDALCRANPGANCPLGEK